MLDIQSGKLSIGKTVISHDLKKGDFLKTQLGKSAEIFVKNEEFISFKVNPLDIFLDKYIPVFFFKVDQLVEIQLFNPLKSNSWVGVSESDHLELKKRNDKALKSHFGSPPYRFLWGEIISDYDNRSNTVKIIIRYKYCSSQGRI